jgi:hypothetical protein
MPDIQHLIQITAKLATIYSLVATGNGFRQWWAEDISEREGIVQLGLFNRTTEYRLRLITDEPPVHADWICETGKEWSGTHIIFRLATGGPGTILRFTHGGWQWDTDYFISCNTTWGELMFRLKAAAEGKSPGPLFRADGLGY